MPRVFTPLMPNQPVSQPQTIEHLLETLDERIELHPVYQRDIRWNQQNMSDLIMSVMKCGLIPGILLYKLQPGDERAKPSYRAECVDGQHRFFTFSHYFNSRLVELPGSKPFLISLNYLGTDGRIIHVFYKETDDTKAWKTENREKYADYMTEAEKDHFNNFLLDIKEIKTPLTLDQRRGLFLNLQKGIAVRGSDLYKNKTDIPLVRFISETMRWEASMKEAMRSHCTLNAKQYWLNWMVRGYLIQESGGDSAKAFMTKDGRITEMLKKGSTSLDITIESEACFKASFMRFFAFMDSLDVGIKLTPTQFFAVFTHLQNAEEGREEIIKGHMREWSTDGMSSKQRRMWENRKFDDEERQGWFERSMDEIERISVPATEVGVRKNLPKKIRGKVWWLRFGEEEEGVCECCGEAITKDNWECGHIKARKCGGMDEESNLVPICRSCNRSMGTENLAVFKARCYPSK